MILFLLALEWAIQTSAANENSCIDRTLVSVARQLRDVEEVFDDLSRLQNDVANIEAIVVSNGSPELRARVSGELAAFSRQIEADMEALVETGISDARRADIQARADDLHTRLARYRAEATPARPSRPAAAALPPQSATQAIESVDSMQALRSGQVYVVPRQLPQFPQRISFNPTVVAEIQSHSGSFSDRILRAIRKGVRLHGPGLEGIMRFGTHEHDVTVFELKIVGPGGGLRIFGCLMGDLIEFVYVGDHKPKDVDVAQDRCRQMLRAR